MPAARKPNALHKLTGTYRRDRHAPAEGKAGSDAPLGPPPNGLADDAAAVWHEVGELAPWLRQSDRHAVEVYSGLMARFRADPLALGGRPLALLSSLGARLGLCWADRQRFRPDPPEGDREPNPFDDLDGPERFFSR